MSTASSPSCREFFGYYNVVFLAQRGARDRRAGRGRLR